MINSQIKKVESDIVNVINNSKVPISIIELIMDKLILEIKNAVEVAIKQEQQTTSESKEKETFEIYPDEIQE